MACVCDDEVYRGLCTWPEITNNNVVIDVTDWLCGFNSNNDVQTTVICRAHRVRVPTRIRWMRAVDDHGQFTSICAFYVLCMVYFVRNTIGSDVAVVVRQSVDTATQTISTESAQRVVNWTENAINPPRNSLITRRSRDNRLQLSKSIATLHQRNETAIRVMLQHLRAQSNAFDCVVDATQRRCLMKITILIIHTHRTALREKYYGTYARYINCTHSTKLKRAVYHLLKHSHSLTH